MSNETLVNNLQFTTLSSPPKLEMHRVVSTSARRLYAAGPSNLHAGIRSLATASPGGVPKPFAEKLASGPTLDDFIAGDVESSGSDRLVLGNTSQ